MSNRLIAVALSLLALLGVSVSLAQRPAADGAARPLDPDTVAVRLILGIGDEAPQDWSGRLALDKGEIVDIEGLRFRDGDLVIGRDSWKASSRLIRKPATPKKAAAKAKAKAKAKARQAGSTPRRSAGRARTAPTSRPTAWSCRSRTWAGPR